MQRISRRRFYLILNWLIEIYRVPVKLEDAVVSQATNKRLLMDNESTDATNKS
jgi:hypothetical protein